MGLETLNYCMWIMVLVLLCTKMTASKDHGEYNTIYACNGEVLKIQCEENYIIKLIRANYGRYSISVCNNNSSTDWNVNCMSHRSFPILHGRCNLKQSCSIVANASLFDDSCPGTVKYLEAHYTCVSATSSSPKVNGEKISPSTKATAEEEYLEERIWAGSNTSLPPISYVTGGEASNTTKKVMLDQDEKQHMCKPTVIRNLTWSWISVGNFSVQPCPLGATGLAQWHCFITSNNVAVHYPDTPDLSECRSVWLTSLESRIGQQDSPIPIAAELCQYTKSKILFGGDLPLIVKIIHDLAHKMQTNIQMMSILPQVEAMAYDQLQSIAQVTSNLLDVSHQASWKDLSHKGQIKVVSSLLIRLEENSLLLAKAISREKVVTLCFKNILLSVQVLEIKNISDERFPTFSLLNGCSLKVENWIQLDKSSLLENSDAGLIRLVYTAFDTLHQTLTIQPNDKEKKVINSKVLSVSLGNGRHIQLTHPVTLCLQHLQLKNMSNPTCVSWDYNQNHWSKEGCSLIKTNETHTICHCSYLTSFAIMVDV